MACLGIHYAIAADLAGQLTRDWPASYPDAVARLESLERQFHALRAEGWVEMTENAWDGIHRSLTNGKLERGDSPRNLCIMGATERYWIRRGDGQLEYIINVLEPGDVRRVADAIQGIDRSELRRGYEGIDPDSFYALNLSEHDFEYTWNNFHPLRAFFARAAEAGRWVVFRVDQ